MRISYTVKSWNGYRPSTHLPGMRKLSALGSMGHANGSVPMMNSKDGYGIPRRRTTPMLHVGLAIPARARHLRCRLLFQY